MSDVALHCRACSIVHGRPASAYQLVLDCTNEAIARKAKRLGKERRVCHVEAHELVAMVVYWSSQTFGLLAQVVLEELGIRRSRDCGDLVAALVLRDVLKWSDGQGIHDFDLADEIDLPAEALGFARLDVDALVVP